MPFLFLPFVISVKSAIRTHSMSSSYAFQPTAVALRARASPGAAEREH
jgi:hypothetical protein